MTMPYFILGAVPDAAVDVAVRAHRRRPLDFPADVVSSAMLNAHLADHCFTARDLSALWGGIGLRGWGLCMGLILPVGEVSAAAAAAATAAAALYTEASRELVEQHGLVEKELRDIYGVFAFLAGMINWSAPVNFSMDKSRTMVWHCVVDSAERVLETYRGLATPKMIPPAPDIKAEFN